MNIPRLISGLEATVFAAVMPSPRKLTKRVRSREAERSRVRSSTAATCRQEPSSRPRMSKCAARLARSRVIRVGPDKGVESAVVYLAEVAKGKAWPTPAKKPEIDNVKCRFVPEVQVIRAGPLDVVNSDPMLHNTHGYYGKRTAFNLALPNKDQRIPVELPRPGTVRVDCDAHGWMEGWIQAVDNPYYAITGADGKFTITEVPPGNYRLVAMQPFIEAHGAARNSRGEQTYQPERLS